MAKTVPVKNDKIPKNIEGMVKVESGWKITFQQTHVPIAGYFLKIRT